MLGKVTGIVIMLLFIATFWVNYANAGTLVEDLGVSKVPAIMIEYTRCDEQVWVVLGHVSNNLAASSGLGRGWQAVVANTLVEALSWAAVMANGGHVLTIEKELKCV